MNDLWSYQGCDKEAEQKLKVLGIDPLFLGYPKVYYTPLKEVDWYAAGRQGFERDLLLEDNEGHTREQRGDWSRGWSDADREHPFRTQDKIFDNT